MHSDDTLDHAPPAATGSARRAWRNAGLVALGLPVLLVAAAGVCELIEWPFLRHPLEARLSQMLDRRVTFGQRFGVRLFGSIRVHTDSMTIGPAPNGGPTLVDAAGRPRDFMHASEVRLALSYRSLIAQWQGSGQPFAVKRLEVDDLELNLKRDADGRANWQFGAAQPATSGPSPQLPIFEHLAVRRGELRMVDEPLQIRAEVHASTREGSAEAAATGGTPGLRVDGQGSYRNAPLLVQLRSSGVLPLAASDASPMAVPLWLEVHAGRSRVRIDGSATDLLHLGGLDAGFEAAGPSLAAIGDALGVTLPSTAKFTTHGRLRKQGRVWDAGIAALDIGSSRLQGEFRFDTAPAVPRLTGTLGGSRLALADLGPAFGAAAPDAPASASGARPGKLIPDRAFDIPSLKAMDADVGVQLAVADLGTAALQPFRPLQGRITLQDGVLRLENILARTSAGEVQGGMSLDSRPANPKWNADLRWRGIQLDRFVTARNVAARKDASGKTPDVGYIGGALGGDAQLKGQGRSTAKLLASLDGSARVWVRDGTVSHLLVEAAGIDIAHALGVYIKGDDKLPMRCALAQFDFADGKVSPKVFVVDTRDSTLLVDGDLSLATESLALRLSAHPHDFSLVAPRTPIDVTGSLADPRIRLEARPLAARGAAAVALSLVNPLAALLALVDFGQPERDVCTGAVARVRGAARTGA